MIRVQTIRRGFVDAPDGQMFYREAGNGPPIVLIHQILRTSLDYESVIPILAERYQQPILPWPTTRGRGCLLDWQLFPIRIGSVNCPVCAVTVIDCSGASPDVLPASSGL